MPSEVKILMTKCEQCKFSEQAGDILYCKRYPPTPILTSTGLSVKWPKVDKIEWCGEFKQKKEKKAD